MCQNQELGHTQGWTMPKQGEGGKVVVKKSFVEPKRTFWTPKKIVKVDLPKKKEIIKKKGNWTCIVGPCDFIDEDGNLIKKS